MTSIRRERIILPMSRLGKPSQLPRFRWQQPMPNRETPPNHGLDDEESRHGFAWGEDSILPYQVSDDYDRNLQPGTLDCLVLENGRLRAVIAPALGGRLLELKDLASGRDLVFRNPVFQPANLAALNAWFSGGIEWNGLIPGHTPFTCAPVFAGVRETSQGPILRLYEFDRIVEATWQVDLFLPEGSAVLFAHGRIVNPNQEQRLAYWWTNVAAPMSPGARVLSPADYSIEHIWPGNELGRCAFPRDNPDPSYPENWENATSVFFRAPSAPRRFIASVDADGYGLMQTATAEMEGRKFFYFGSAVGGQNWMDYLARPGEGRYLEIQSGVAPTQNQRFALAPGAELDWTEAYLPVQLDAGAAHDAYGTAVEHAAGALDALVPEETLARIDALLRHEARQPLDQVLSTGERWGARQELLLGRRLADGLDFAVDGAEEVWDALARDGVVAPEQLEVVPEGIVVSKAWLERVQQSAERQGTSWLHELILGTAALDREARDAARQHVGRSLALRSSWAAYRLQALLAEDADATLANYLAAWQQGDAPPELAVEIATFLMAQQRPAALKAFVEALPEAVRDRERIVLARAVVAADAGQFDELERLLLERQYASIREGETLLSDLWMRLQRGRLEAELGRAAAAEEVAARLRLHPLPRQLDLRMHDVEAS